MRRMAGNRAILLAAVFVGVLIGIGSYTFVYAKGYSYLTNDPARVRQLPRHAGSLRRVDAREPSVGRRLQRLPHAARARPEVRDEGAERLLAFVLLHDRALSRSAADHAAQSRASPSRRAASATPS